MLKNLALALGVSLVCFLAFEAGVRVVLGDPPVFRYPQVGHEATPYGYRPVPGQAGVFTLDAPVRTNSHGFRGPEWTPLPETDRPRVLVIGDSFTFGNGVVFDSLYTTWMERALDGTGRDVEVLNASAGGWNLPEEIGFFLLVGAGLRPDAVVLGLFPNDLLLPRPEGTRVELTDDARLEGRPPWLRWVPYRAIFAVKRSAAIWYVRDRIGVIRAGRTLVNQLVDDQMELDGNPRIEYAEAVFREIRDSLAQWDGRLVLAALPSVNQFWTRADTPAWVRHFEAFAREEGVGFVDVATAFRRQEGTDALYKYPWDNHFSPAGHRVAGEAIAAAVAPLILRESPRPGG